MLEMGKEEYLPNCASCNTTRKGPWIEPAEVLALQQQTPEPSAPCYDPGKSMHFHPPLPCLIGCLRCLFNIILPCITYSSDMM